MFQTTNQILWFSYGFPNHQPEKSQRSQILRDESRLRRCRFDAKVIADLEHLAARKWRSIDGNFPNCPVSLPEEIHDYT
jgi:hypothetical protein